MATVVYFLEDDSALNSYIYMAQLQKSFPGCSIIASEYVKDAIDWSKKNNRKVVFVIHK